MILDNFELAKKYFLEGINDLERGLFQEAEGNFLESLRLVPDRVSTLTNLSATQIKLKKLSEAKIAAEKAVLLDIHNTEAYLNLGLIAKEEHCLALAIKYFNKALDIKPDIEIGYLNKGATLKDLKCYDEALAAYEKALALNPNYAEAWSNKGVVYEDLKRYDEALAAYEKALALNPNYAEAWSNKGVVYEDLKCYDEALAAYEKALQIKPHLNYLLGQAIYSRMLAGNWVGLDSIATDLSEQIACGHKVAMPFAVLSISDSPKLHLEASKTWVEDKYPQNFSLPPIDKKLHSKIRIGYFSADFRNHPVSILTSELFKLHNRENFEITAFSLQGANQGDLIRKELNNTFDQFHDLENKSDLEIAKLSREMEIDIAVDLGGHTRGARTGIFSYRAALIQVNYLGYPGTLGAEYMDYIIADQVVIPESSMPYYKEKIAYLPDTYMVDDSRRQISHKKFSRSDFGLPIDGLVFCAFNNSYKFNIKILEGWARILLKVPQGVLWISENNQLFRKNILDTLTNLGINSNRIIFAKKLESPEDHLGRHQLADLFLDTSPYNAHTTAIDALRSGLPVLTLQGEAFAGRVAASLLRAIGLSGLIANTQGEYESLAIELASYPEKLQDVRAQLKSNLATKPLFNTQLFTKNIESAYKKMYSRYQSGLAPDHFLVSGA